MLAAISQARADDKRTSSLGIDVNVYPHQSRIDSDTDLTVIANAGLPGRFSYFSFLNYVGAIGSGDMRLDRSEQNLR